MLNETSRTWWQQKFSIKFIRHPLKIATMTALATCQDYQ